MKRWADISLYVGHSSATPWGIVRSALPYQRSCLCEWKSACAYSPTSRDLWKEKACLRLTSCETNLRYGTQAGETETCQCIKCSLFKTLVMREKQRLMWVDSSKGK
jgi:hypothetical protein